MNKPTILKIKMTKEKQNVRIWWLLCVNNPIEKIIIIKENQNARI
jgi:hypothetical protein